MSLPVTLAAVLELARFIAGLIAQGKMAQDDLTPEESARLDELLEESGQAREDALQQWRDTRPGGGGDS